MKTQQFLNVLFYGSIILALTFVLLFETDILIGGGLADNRSADFLCAVFLELLSICAIPVAFRLVRPGQSNLSRISYERRAILRLLMLSLPMVVNTFAYYSFMGVHYGYMAIILFICLFFVMPTKSRFEREQADLQNTDNTTAND